MHDDDNRFQRFVPLLRRVIILLAVLAATPVVLWMITTFVRAYVGPPRIPALRQTASTQQMAAPAAAAASAPNSEASTKVADFTALTTDVTATTSEARDAASPKGSMLADRPSEAANLPTTAPVPSMPSPSQTSAALASAAPIGQSPAANTVTAEASPPPAVAEQQPDVMPAAPPLTGKIPLPRHRPRGLGDATMTQMAQGAVPVPRPRPDGAGPVATPETPNSGPLDFLQNMFHQ
ncbi:MAG: hypothetical protein WA851_27565 [Xanthobacteraceae bacterium]